MDAPDGSWKNDSKEHGAENRLAIKEARTEVADVLTDTFVTFMTDYSVDVSGSCENKISAYNQAENDTHSNVIRSVRCKVGHNDPDKNKIKSASPCKSVEHEIKVLKQRDVTAKENTSISGDTEACEMGQTRTENHATEENFQGSNQKSEEKVTSDDGIDRLETSLKNDDTYVNEVTVEKDDNANDGQKEKIKYCSTNTKNESEFEGALFEASLTDKHENVQKVRDSGRPKRRRSCQVSYDESDSEVWGDSESLLCLETLNNGQTKQPKKKRASREASQRIRIIHSDFHFVEMFENLYKLQKTEKYCDLKLCASDGHVFVHSIIIIAASPFLHKKYKEIQKTQTNEENVRDLVFQNIPLWALEKIVTFLYTGILEVFEKDSKDLSKHCKSVGLNDLHKKLCSKQSSSGVETDSNVPLVKGRKEMETSFKGGTALVLGTGKSQVEGNSRKRRLRPEKTEGSKRKLSKVTDDEEKIDVKEEDSMIVKCETSENSLKVADSINATPEEKAKNDVAYTCTFNFENEVNKIGDSELKGSFDESGDDTDSYFENDKVKKKAKVKKKDMKRKIKKVVKKEQKTTAKLKNKVKTSGVIGEIVDKEEQETIDETETGKNKIEMSATESNEKVTVVLEAGNGGECDRCGKSFYFQYELTGHKNRCTGKNNRQRRKCVTCRQSFDSTEEYMDHRNTDEKCLALRQEKLVIRKQKRFEMRRKFCCCVCPRKFRRLADQIEHEYLAHEIQYDKQKWPDLYCEYCNYWSMNPWKLHHHKLVSCNKGQEPICDMCGNSYKNEKTLKKHKELMHTDVQPMLTCEECGKTLKGKKGLKHHIRLRHRGENLHNLMMCHICSQTYRTSSDLTFHLYRVHEQPLPEGFHVFRCPKCDYCHNNKRFYEKHMFLHEDKREWHCEICSKAFKTKNSLNTHMIVHTSSRIPCPFDDCTYKALKNCHLKNHIENQHTQKGEKHEKCHLCDYATFFRGNLIKHQRSVHKLEVVTRHSVEMKARYKNLKSGQIVGVEKTPGTEKSSCRSRSSEGEYHASSFATGSSRDLLYPVSSSSENSIVENQLHFQDKNVPMPSSQNVADSFMYTLVNTPIMSQHSNFPLNTSMYRMPPADFSVYSQNSSMEQSSDIHQRLM